MPFDPFHVGFQTLSDQATGIELACIPRSPHKVDWLTGWLAIGGFSEIYLGLQLPGDLPGIEESPMSVGGTSQWP